MIFKAIKSCTRKSLAYTAFGALALGLCTQTSLAQTNKVIGYIPSYADMRAVVDRTDLTKLTHINLAFANPTSSGVVANGTNPACMYLNEDAGILVTGSDIAYVVNKAHSAGVKVMVSVAGGGLPKCAGNWRTLLSTSRQTLVNNYVQFVNNSNLDGIDIDIEGALLTSIDADGNYTPFIQALRNALPGKLVTAATGNYDGGMIPESSLPIFDFVGLMSYDAVGPWGANTGGEHSSYQFASDSIDLWVSKGLPKSKIILGVPFYGYGFGGMPESMTFASIIATYGSSVAQNDVIGNLCAGCSYITYNGIPTIRKKAQLAKDNIGGVMIWELSQDASGSNSLLATIASVMGSSTQPESGPAGYTRCASENQTCSFTGSANVAYGANGKFNYRDASGSISCNNSTFGDPISGVAKACYYKTTTTTPQGPAGYTRCAGENQTCTFSGAASVAFGANGAFNYRNATNSIACNNATFGDPIKNVVKACYYKLTTTTGTSITIQAEAYANMSGIQVEATNDVDGVQNVGWIDTGDWMTYTNVNIPASGSYRIDYRVASLPGGGILTANLNNNAIQFPSVNIGSTGDWQKWTTVSQTVTINAGTYTLGLYASAGNWNINWIKITKL